MENIPTLTQQIKCKSLAFATAMKRLDEQLQIEIKADRYDEHIGFNE